LLDSLTKIEIKRRFSIRAKCQIIAARKALEHQAHGAERKDTEAKIHKEAIIAVFDRAKEDQELSENLGI
jgi:hypothetical protein